MTPLGYETTYVIRKFGSCQNSLEVTVGSMKVNFQGSKIVILSLGKPQYVCINGYCRNFWSNINNTMKSQGLKLMFFS